MVGFSPAAISNTSSVKIIPGVCRGVNVSRYLKDCRYSSERVVQGFMGCKYVNNDTVCQFFRLQYFYFTLLHFYKYKLQEKIIRF